MDCVQTPLYMSNVQPRESSVGAQKESTYENQAFDMVGLI
jgi:hypothetical protein